MRVLGAPEPAADAAARARVEAGEDRIARLRAAARECREYAARRNGDDPEDVEEGLTAPRGLAGAVARELAASTARLPDRQREALALRELLRLSYEQIAQVMGIEQTAVVAAARSRPAAAAGRVSGRGRRAGRRLRGPRPRAQGAREQAGFRADLGRRRQLGARAHGDLPCVRDRSRGDARGVGLLSRLAARMMVPPDDGAPGVTARPRVTARPGATARRRRRARSIAARPTCGCTRPAASSSSAGGRG